MDFDFSAEQYALRDEARRFLEQQCPAAHVRETAADPAGWSRALWKQLADLGWMALPFPEDCGGLGRGFLDLTLLLGELGRALAPVPYLSSVVLAGHAIAAHGSAEQRFRLLPGVASGDRVGALAIPQPGFPAGTTVAATRDGDAWRLDGECRHVLDATAADLIVAAAGDRLFVVEDGFTPRASAALDVTRPIGTIVFDGAPAEPLERDGLWPAIGYGIAALCAEMTGTAQKILDMTVEYSKVREQFGRPIGSFQAIKHRCAEMATDLEAARSAAMYACWAVASGAADAEIACSVAKSFCSESLARLAGEGVQVHGGIAFTWEHDMHLYLRRIKSAEALLGDAAFHRERLATLVGL